MLEEFSMYTVYATSFSPLSIFESENHAAGVFLIAIGGVITSTRPGVVELRQQVFKPSSHYRTEQRDRFDDPGPQPRNDTLVPSVTVHLGDDRPGYSLQSHAVHRKIPSEEQDGAKALRAAGSGILIPTAVFPKPVRCNPVTGGPRTPDVYDLGVANQVRHDRVSQNSSSIIREAHVRNPISGDCIPLQQYANPRGEVPA